MASIDVAIGITGVVLYSIVFVIAVYRVYKHVVPYRPPWFSTRKTFHVFLALYGLLQAISFTSFIEGKPTYDKWTYCTHLFGIFSEVVAFSLVSILWSKTLMSRNNARRCVIPFLLLVDSIFLFYILYLIIDMSLTKGDFTSWTEGSFTFMEMLIVEPVILAINGLCISYLGVRITQRLTMHPSWTLLASSQKRSILFRLIGTMVVCCVSFLMRATFEIMLFINGAKDIPYIEWWVFSTWLPTITPALVLMYTMRRTDSRSKRRMSSESTPRNNKQDERNHNYDINNSSGVINSRLWDSGERDSLFSGESHRGGIQGNEDDYIHSNNDPETDEDEFEDVIHGGNATSAPLLEKDQQNNNNNHNHIKIDFFRGAPDLRPSFYRTQGHADSDELA